MTSAPPQGGGSDYICSVGGVRDEIWEPIYGGNSELSSYKNFEHNLELNV